MLPTSFARLAGCAAAVLFVLAVATFGAALDGYSQMRHPVALLGAAGVPRAWAFNLLAWIVPGALAAALAVMLRGRLPTDARAAARVGVQMLLLAGLAFAGMGVWPLQVEDLDGRASQLHASLWMVWILAFAVGALMLAAGLRRVGGAGALVALAVACAVIALLGAFALGAVLPQPLAQRVVFAAWALWLAVALPLWPGRTTAG